MVVTGAGDGSIGASVALAFARARARKIALVGRTEATLQKTKKTIEQAFPDATVMVSPGDMSKSESVGTAAHYIRVQLGAWDVFANCAGYLPDKTTIGGADEDDWWSAFEIHVKFIAHFAKHFLPKCRPDATFINTNTSACLLPSSSMPKTSAYCASKLAMAKLDECLADENPRVRVFTVHPGVVPTRMLEKAFGPLPSGDLLDEPELAANFMVWLASPLSEFLKSGRFLWVNWDVEELIARKAEIEANPLLFRITIGGWPFQ